MRHPLTQCPISTTLSQTDIQKTHSVQTTVEMQRFILGSWEAASQRTYRDHHTWAEKHRKGSSSNLGGSNFSVKFSITFTEEQ